MKIKFLFLSVLSFLVQFSFSQVNESFDDWIDTSYGANATATLPSGEWSNNNALLGSYSRTGSKGVRFNEDSGANEYLRYHGLDGNGKDNGIGKISFWYRHWDADGSAVAFQVEYSLDNGTTWVSIGNVVNVSLDSFVQFSATVNLDADNILIQVRSVSDDERMSIDDFTITDFVCTAIHTVTSFTPTEGPVGTNVTISGTGYTAGTTVSLGSQTATIISQTTTTIVVELPSGISTNPFVITESGCDITTTNSFTVFDTSGGCLSGPSFTDIFISEVTDASSGSLSYIEIYNGTGAAIDLGAENYALRFKSNGGPETDLALSGILNDQDSFIFATSVGSGCSVPGGDGSYADQSEVFSGVNNNDCISLLKNVTIIDVWGECDGSNWITALGLGSAGYDFQRKATATAPNTTFNDNDWTIVDYDSCNDNYTDIETYAGSTSFPSITNQPSNVGTCDNTASFSIDAVPTNSGTLTYQWYYNNGSSSAWTAVTNSSFGFITVTGETTDTMVLNGPVAMLSGYQFYCEVQENGACAASSHVSLLKSEFTTWNGTTWSDGLPESTSAAVINADYDTSVNGSFSACSLIVNSTNTLTVGNNSYIEITNDIVNNGEIIVKDQGSVVQINDTATYNDTGSTATNPTIVEKLTAPLNNWYEYTYWSSPVEDAAVGTALSQANAGRRFWFEAANYVDTYYENNNDNTQTYGPAVDGVDDNNDIWQLAGTSDVMTPGIGYIASHSTAAMGSPGDEYLYDFRGELNTGDITVAVERNDDELLDFNWNLIGNPYASAISVDDFFNDNVFGTATNGRIEAEIYLWTHSTPPSAVTNGNETYNFNLLDYATINASGAIAGGDLNNDGTIDALDIPERFIPSCQSFFVKYSQSAASTTGNVVFKNNMRSTGNNSQFFRTANVNQPNRLWLNLSSDFGVFNQSLIAYVDGASAGMNFNGYDTKKIGLYKSSIGLYSIVEDDNVTEKLCIQGKNPSDLNLDEVVKLGFKNGITAPTIYTITIDKIEGDFLTNNTVYLKDNYLNTYTNLSTNDYSFTTEVGEFTDRFEIVFKMESLSSPDFDTVESELTMVELQDGSIEFKTNSNINLQSITIYNTLGQRIYNSKNIKNISHNLTLNHLSSAMYIAEIILENDVKIVKKGIKQ